MFINRSPSLFNEFIVKTDDIICSAKFPAFWIWLIAHSFCSPHSSLPAVFCTWHYKTKTSYMCIHICIYWQMCFVSGDEVILVLHIQHEGYNVCFVSFLMVLRVFNEFRSCQLDLSIISLPRKLSPNGAAYSLRIVACFHYFEFANW